ncbi:MAG: AsnC family transcriptional regulator [Candidatus Micrarchaeota archaeon]|nr:AsnC family transcriptional regulator [Candidatus Micrarchaeota archaeon]
MDKLDIKDKKILYELDLNARQPDSEIAKKVGLSRDAVRYRIDKMLNDGYIKHFTVVVNTMKLGFDWYRLLVRLQNLTVEKEREMMEWLKPRTSYLTKAEGRWDLIMSAYYRDVYEFRDLLNSFLAEYGDYIAGYDLSVTTRFWHFHRNYLVGIKEKPMKFEMMGFNEGEPYRYAEIDETDYKVLAVLTKDARMKTVDIARKTGTTEMIVKYRIRKLMDDGVILGFRPLFDTKRLGYIYFKVHFTLRSAAPNRRKLLFAYVQQYNNSLYAVESIGGSDFEAHVEVRTTDELYSYIHSIRSRFGDIIGDYYFMEYKDEIKWTFLPEMKFVK